MKCPQCFAPTDPPQNACPACGFSAAKLHRLIGNQWVKLERITDAAHCLRLDEVRACEVALDEFERTFPQAFFAAYLGVLPDNLNPSMLGFWLLNQGAFNTYSLNKRNDFGIMLVIDPATQIASLSYGYSLERCFGDRENRKLLSEAARNLAAGAFGEAIKAACMRCGQIMRAHARSRRWVPEIVPVSSQASEMGLQTLRGGHRQPQAATVHLPR